jgi:stage V sporulation protein D (sporulation-specific penicillin-binding protein)
MGALPIGQEMAVTITQLARAFCVIANGGQLVRPYVVERAVDREGEVTYRHETEAPQRVLSEHTAVTMRELCHLVCIGGTGSKASIAEYRTGGKTGTAQIARPDGQGYYPDKYTTIFAGFAPLNDPRLVCVILVQEPAIKLHYGGYVCGPVFHDVVRETLSRMDCPLDPVVDATAEPEPAAVEDETELADADTVLAQAEEIRDARNGTGGTTPRQADSDDLTEDPDYLLREMALTSLDGSPPVANEPRLSDLRGMTKRQAKAYVDTLGMRWDIQGAGRVVSQFPPAGTPLREVLSCRLVFSSDSLEETDESQELAELVPVPAPSAS